METKRHGFTFIEVVVVVGMMAMLGGLVVVNLFGSQRTAQLVNTVEPMVADMKVQQTKAMTREAVGGVLPDGYGIRFESNRYILFHGSSYSISEPSNQVFPLEPRVRLSQINFPNSVIVFAMGSGEIVGFTPGSDTVTIEQIDSNNTKTIQLNRYGVVTAIN